VSNAQRLGLIFVFCWFFFGGLSHFLYDDAFLRIVPHFVSAPESTVAVIGILEMIGAIGVLLAPTRRLAGLCLFVLTLLVTPANLHMWVHFDQYPDYSPTLLALRLLLQILLLALILFSTQPLPAPRKAAA
jgi:uncharacterized membrane protein